MQKLSSFVFEAGRGRPRKNKDVDTIDPESLGEKELKEIDKKAKNAERQKGKSEEENNTHGLWAVEPPYEDGAVNPIPDEDYDENLINLQAKFDAEEPFFIQGKAGWGKTSIIEDMAKRAGRHIITVYLDKAVATDLGGLPVPVNENGVAKIVNAMPDWAAYMLKNKDKDFLLFFDEMNQAAPDVMNALMPIVLKNVICNIKFNNFIVGAAGNFEDENGAVNELSGPLKSRFKPIIVWQSGGEAWKSTFKYLHKEWDDKLGKDFIDKFQEKCEVFDNPRELEHKVFKFIYNLKSKGKVRSIYNVNWNLNRLKDLVRPEEEIGREGMKDVTKLAELIYEWLNSDGNTSANKEEKGEEKSRRSRGQDMISDKAKTYISNGIQRGYIKIKESKIKYGISKENINGVFCDPEVFTEAINAEMLERLINKLEADGITFKFKTNKEFLDAGYEDPLAD